jgi:hypothetical protein
MCKYLFNPLSNRKYETKSLFWYSYHPLCGIAPIAFGHGIIRLTPQTSLRSFYHGALRLI